MVFREEMDEAINKALPTGDNKKRRGSKDREARKKRILGFRALMELIFNRPHSRMFGREEFEEDKFKY